MPRPKTWFRVSHDIFDDAEVWEFLTLHGDRAMLTWLWILSGLNRSDNHFRLSGDWLGSASRRLRQTPASLRRQLGWLLATGWLTPGQTAADGSPTVLTSPNYARYNGTRVHKPREFLTPTRLDETRRDERREETEKEKMGLSATTPPTPKPTRGCVYPDGFEPDERAQQLAQSYGLNVHQQRAAFQDHHVAKGSVFKDWQAAFRNWLRNSVKFAQRRQP